MIRKFLATSAVLMLLTAHSQAALIGSFVLDQKDLAASDGGSALTVDTYKFDVASTESADVTSVELDFNLTTWAIPGINAGFRNAPALPVFLGSSLADSFFVTDGTQLVGSSEDTASRLYAAYTYPGTKAIVPAGGTATLAYLTVPSGSTPETIAGTFAAGSGAVAGAFVNITLEDDTTPPGIEAMYVGPGASISEGLQGAFAARNFGPIMLADAFMLSNVNGGELAELDPLTAEILIGTDNAVGSIEDLDGDGKYDILIDADFASLAPGATIGGEILFASGADGANPNLVGFDFSVSVPEPSTVALSALALVGLVGLARRRG